MQVKFKKTDERAKMPTMATAGSACFDLYAASIDDCQSDGVFSVTYNTGLQVEIPQGYAMMIYSRSGHGFNKGITLANSTGVIDSDYRGDIKVKLVSSVTHSAQFPEVGERIAQAMIIPIPVVQFIEVDELSDTERGAGGFGSTGE